MSEATEPQKKRRLGDFEIVREIGRGGMGIVYEARQLSLNRKVALKVLSGGLGLSSKAVVRFRREAEAAAKLHHTNIVPIYATGEHEGTHFYAMEFVEGPSLNVVVRQMRSPGAPGATELQESPSAERPSTVSTPLPQWVAETLTQDVHEATPSQRGVAGSAVGDASTTLTTGSGYFDNIARMMAEVADGLDYAHDQGVIHRDIGSDTTNDTVGWVGGYEAANAAGRQHRPAFGQPLEVRPQGVRRGPLLRGRRQRRHQGTHRPEEQARAARLPGPEPRGRHVPPGGPGQNGQRHVGPRTAYRTPGLDPDRPADVG